MKIVRLRIQNYKSIKDIDITLSDKVNVFIGENSVGKSNIFSAIDWILGPIYPSFHNFAKEVYRIYYSCRYRWLNFEQKRRIYSSLFSFDMVKT